MTPAPAPAVAPPAPAPAAGEAGADGVATAPHARGVPGRDRAPGAAGAPGRRGPASAPAPVVDPNAPWFGLRIGDAVQRIPLAGELVRERTREAFAVDVGRLGLAIPGLRFTRLRLTRGADGVPNGGTLSGEISAPFVRGNARLSVDADGNLSGGVENIELAVEVFGRPRVSFVYRDRRWQGGGTVEGKGIRLPIPNVTIDEGNATVSFAGDQLTGSLTARFHHAALGEGNVAVTLSGAGVAGSGGFTLKMPLLQGSQAAFRVDERGKMAAELALTADQVNVPIPGLSVSGVTGSIALADGHVKGLFGLSAAYAGLASLSLTNVRVGDRGFAGGAGALEVTAPPVQGSKGSFSLDAQGRPSGSLTITSSKIPIPILKRGRLTIALRPDGGVEVSGAGTVELGPVGGGDFTVGYDGTALLLGAGVNVNVPGLQPVRGRLDYKEGQLQGDMSTGVTVGPLSGSVTLRYRDQQFSGDGRLDYSQGRFAGWVLIHVDPEGGISGEGEGTFRLADWLTGTIGLVVHPDLNVDARGELVVTNPIKLFGPYEFEESFFNFDEDFPLWGISIPVVGSIGLVAEVHANAGFRANFGPGILSNIRAVGEISTRPDAEPAFAVSGDLVIPAGAEVILTVGGGIGLSVVVAKLSGGIDLSGIAGVYGSLTLTPTFAYRDGEYLLRGDALLQATAQLRARIDAYAKVRVGVGWLSKTVWRENWNLKEWIFDSGWQVGVRASVEHVLGRPFEPKVSYDEVDVDPVSLIKAAVPKSGEPVSAPVVPPAPVAQFVSPDPQPPAEAAPPPGGAPAAAVPGEPPPAQPDVPGAPAGGPEAAQAGGAEGTPPTIGLEADDAAPEEHVDPPPAADEEGDKRSVDETYLVYVYEQLEQHLRRRRATAPPDRELIDEAVRKAEEEPAAAAPVPLGGESTGKPLSPELRSGMERAFGDDLSNVRVHTDEAARESSAAIGAEAFAAGSDIFFGPSRNPEAGDEKLLAHELTHVVQEAGDGSEVVSRPTDELEREAEEAAAAIARGEPPKPIKKRQGGAGIHRAEGRTVSASAKTKFTKQKWDEMRAAIRTDPRLKDNKVLQEAIASLESPENVKNRAKERYFDDELGRWVAREWVPMHFPAARYLAHTSVTGTAQIGPGDVLVRSGEDRDDASQSELSRLMYSGVAPNPKPGTPWFTKSPRGEVELPTQQQQWDEYKDNEVRVQAKAAGALNDVPEFAEGQKTSESRANLSLTREAFNYVWRPRPEGLGYYFAGGKWRTRTAEGAEDVDVDAETKVIMVADYEAHHVIPLWLRSGSDKADGDQLDNLAPWHKSAHQVNHSFHYVPAEEVQEATDVTDYRHFKVGTRFLLHEFPSKKTPHPPGVPKVELGPDKKWISRKAGPIWME